MKYNVFKKLTMIILSLCLIVIMAGVSIAATDWGKGGSLTTASVGGTFYVWGGAFSKLIADRIPNYQVSVEVTGGPVHNLKMVNDNLAEYGLCSMPIAYDAYHGLSWAKGKKYQNSRTLFPMYPSAATIWALKKYNVNNVHDINGKIINLAPKGGTPDTYYRMMFNILGIKPKKIVNSGFSDMVGEMQDGMIQAGAGTGGDPFGPAMETESTHEITVVSFLEEDRDKILKEIPSWYKANIKKDGYKSLTNDVPTLGYWNIFITNKELPEDLAYNITKAFFENLDYFYDVVKYTTLTKPEDVLKSVIPIHSGAARYYKEVGVNIPSDLIN